MLKRIAALITAFFLVNGFCALYYNPGVQYALEGGATGFARGGYHYSARMNEGISVTRADRFGYNNIDEYLYGAEINIVVMGTSHFEGYNVSQSDTLVSALNRKLRESGAPFFAYNIAASSHSTLINLANFDNVIKTYPDVKYIVFEFNGISATRERLAAAIAGEGGKITTMDSGFLYYAQRVPLFKAAYSQVKKLGGGMGDMFRSFLLDPIGYTKYMLTRKPPQPGATVEPYNPYPDFINRLSEFAEARDIDIILINHPYLALSSGGGASIDENAAQRAEIAELCAGTRVTFIDMSEIFLNDYLENRRLHHGFANTKLNSGHLNATGHSLIAAALYDYFTEAAQ